MISLFRFDLNEKISRRILAACLDGMGDNGGTRVRSATFFFFHKCSFLSAPFHLQLFPTPYLSVQVLEEYVKLFDMRDKTFVEALRAFLKEFRLPGEVTPI